MLLFGCHISVINLITGGCSGKSSGYFKFTLNKPPYKSKFNMTKTLLLRIKFLEVHGTRHSIHGRYSRLIQFDESCRSSVQCLNED